MHNRSLSRELSLLSLGLIKDDENLELNKFQIEEIFESALDSLVNHCRDELDICEANLENVSQNLLDSELKEGCDSSFGNVRDELKKAFYKIESIMNSLSVTLDFPKLLVSSNQNDIREDVNFRISSIIKNLQKIDSEIDAIRYRISLRIRIRAPKPRIPTQTGLKSRNRFTAIHNFWN